MIYSCDIETYDPHLLKMGPGSRLNDGYIIGVGLYDGKQGHFLDPVDILKLWQDPKVTLVFHNAVYDVDWLSSVLGPFNCTIDDTLTRETLIDNLRLSYSLENCCQAHGLEGKNKSDTIDKYWKGKGKAVQHLNEIPREIVAKYCIQDCVATYNLYYAQQPILEKMDLLRANAVEQGLYPWLMACRENGVRLNNKLLLELSDKYNNELDKLKSDFNKEFGDINVNSARDLELLWKKLQLPIEYTDSGRPSFTADILLKCKHPVAHTIREIKFLEKLLNTYINGQFMDLQYRGRLWPVMYPAKRDGEGGTITGRFSSANPNIQNISSREDKHGPEVRSIIIPEDDCYLGAFDYKQIEYRTFMHCAAAIGAPTIQKVVEEFKVHDIDYHTFVQHMLNWDNLGKDGRHIVKMLNFGTLYGLGPRSFSIRFREPLLKSHPECSEDDLYNLAQSLQHEYFTKIPFVKSTMDAIMNVGRQRGYVKTLSGRHQKVQNDSQVYKLVNYIAQGDAADIFKMGQLLAWRAGVYKVLHPHFMVHDEMVFSIPRTKEGYDACLTLQQCMEDAYKEVLRIPLGVDTEIGPDWGHCDEDTCEKEVKKFETKNS